MSGSPRLISLNTSVPGTLSWRGHDLRTGIFKQPVAGRRQAGMLGLAGDHVEDLRVHGGADKALYAYPSEHYAFWREQYPGLEIGWGAFGENLTLAGLLEDGVQVGDRFRAGNAELEVSQFRIPCFKLARKLGQPNLVKRFLASGRCGWYLRVVKEGGLGTGDEWELLSRDPAGSSIAELIELYRGREFHRMRLAAAAGLQALPAPWREKLTAWLRRKEPAPWNKSEPEERA